MREGGRRAVEEGKRELMIRTIITVVKPFSTFLHNSLLVRISQTLPSYRGYGTKITLTYKLSLHAVYTIMEERAFADSYKYFVSRPHD